MLEGRVSQGRGGACTKSPASLIIFLLFFFKKNVFLHLIEKQSETSAGLLPNSMGWARLQPDPRIPSRSPLFGWQEPKYLDHNLPFSRVYQEARLGSSGAGRLGDIPVWDVGVPGGS